MKFIDTKFNSLKIIEPDIFMDERGEFIKSFLQSAYLRNSLGAGFVESYYSISKKNVIRGMHFQTPPADHIKLVYVTQGKILDVVLDIRKGSPNYGKYFRLELSADNHKAIYIPSGFAHGFLALEDNSCVIYSQTSEYSAENDRGVKFDSFGLDWGIDKHIVSKRDCGFPRLQEFNSPFVYKNL